MHYDHERQKRLEKYLLDEEKRKPKLNRSGEIVFLISILFIVLSILFLASCSFKEKTTNHECEAQCKTCTDLIITCSLNGEHKEIKVNKN